MTKWKVFMWSNENWNTSHENILHFFMVFFFLFFFYPPKNYLLWSFKLWTKLILISVGFVNFYDMSILIGFLLIYEILRAPNEGWNYYSLVIINLNNLTSHHFMLKHLCSMWSFCFIFYAINTSFSFFFSQYGRN